MMYYVTQILGASEMFVAFLTIYCVSNLTGPALTKPLTDWKCKVIIFWWTNALLAAISFTMLSVPMQADTTVSIFTFVIGVLYQLVTPIQWVVMSDTVDHGEQCNDKRLTGISFADALFVLKLGLVLGGALIGWMLAYGGYDATERAQNNATTSIVTASLMIVSVIYYLPNAIIIERYYSLMTHNLKTAIEQLA